MDQNDLLQMQLMLYTIIFTDALLNYITTGWVRMVQKLLAQIGCQHRQTLKHCLHTTKNYPFWLLPVVVHCSRCHPVAFCQPSWHDWVAMPKSRPHSHHSIIHQRTLPLFGAAWRDSNSLLKFTGQTIMHCIWHAVLPLSIPTVWWSIRKAAYGTLLT